MFTRNCSLLFAHMSFSRFVCSQLLWVSWRGAQMTRDSLRKANFHQRLRSKCWLSFLALSIMNHLIKKFFFAFYDTSREFFYFVIWIYLFIFIWYIFLIYVFFDMFWYISTIATPADAFASLYGQWLLLVFRFEAEKATKILGKSLFYNWIIYDKEFPEEFSSFFCRSLKSRNCTLGVNS